MIIGVHVDALLDIAPLQTDAVGELRDMYDVINVHTRNLQEYAICATSYGPVLISIIRSNLPQKFMEHIARQMPPGKWDVSALMEAFKNEVMSKERCISSYERDNSSKQNQNGEIFSASALYGQQQGNGWKDKKNQRDQQKSFACIFCKGSHFADQCTSVTDVETRKAILRRQNKCFICLKTSHIAREGYSRC